MLLVLLMSSTLVLPQGMDLVLCFGKDGHVDFSLNSCREGSVPSGDQSAEYHKAHHDVCFDLIVTCGTAKEVVCTAGKMDSDKFKSKKDLPKTPLLFWKSLADFTGSYLNLDIYSISFEDFPSLHLVSARTVILLI